MINILGLDDSTKFSIVVITIDVIIFLLLIDLAYWNYQQREEEIEDDKLLKGTVLEAEYNVSISYHLPALLYMCSPFHLVASLQNLPFCVFLLALWCTNSNQSMMNLSFFCMALSIYLEGLHYLIFIPSILIISYKNMRYSIGK